MDCIQVQSFKIALFSRFFPSFLHRKIHIFAPYFKVLKIAIRSILPKISKKSKKKDLKNKIKEKKK